MAMLNFLQQQNTQNLQAPQPMYALPPPPPSVLNQQVVQNRENVQNQMIPFQPNFNENSNDQEVPSFDINELLNDVMADNRNQVISNQNTNNVNIPRSMFSNCSIANITFNIQK